VGRSLGERALPGTGTWDREPSDLVTPQPSVELPDSAQKVDILDIDTKFGCFVNPLFAGEAEAEA
jgi:hypothetical protein